MKNEREDIAFKIQEMDRQRIARDLHDTSLQNLAHMTHKLELASMYIDKDIIQAKLEIETIRRNINDIIDEIRNVIFDLRPMSFDDLGLKETIEDMLEKVKKNSNLIVASDIDVISLEEECMLGIFRVIQECVMNVYKHAKAKHLWVSVKERKNKIDLEIEDDGIGFEVETVCNKDRHFGIYIMKERVEILSGKLELVSEKNKGTKILVTIPK